MLNECWAGLGRAGVPTATTRRSAGWLAGLAWLGWFKGINDDDIHPARLAVGVIEPAKKSTEIFIT
jgi:hypothetical protein